MKSKFVRVLTLILTLVFILAFIVACDGNDATVNNKDVGGSVDNLPETGVEQEELCEHQWSQWTETKAPTCKEMGGKLRSCTLCGEKEEKTIAKTAHEYNADNVCQHCGEELEYTTGLLYERVNNYSKAYAVAGIGTATETNIVIPAQHAGWPVTTIKSSAFYGNDKITSITLASGITEIGASAFYYCDKLQVANLGGVTKIGGTAFKNCKNLQVVKTNSVKEIGLQAFAECEKLNDINLGEEKISIGQNAFLNTGYYNASDNWESASLYIGKHLITVKQDFPSKTFSIKKGTKSIAAYAFNNVTAIETINFPENEIQIGSCAFIGCTNWKEFEVTDIMTLEKNALSGTALTELIAPMKYVIDSVSNSTFNVNVNIPLTLETLIVTKSSYSYSSTTLVQFDFSKFTKLEHLEHPFNNAYNYNGGWKLINAYAGMKKLKSLTIPGERKAVANGYGEIAFHIGEYFSTESYEGSVSVSASLDYKSYTFYFPSTLKEITIDGGYVREGMFNGCDNFETITIKNLAKRDDNNIGSGAFNDIKCKNLILDKSVNYITCVGKYDYELGHMANGADNLFYKGTMEDWLLINRGSLYADNIYINGQKMEGELIIPDGIIEIPADAFNGFDKISSMKIPDSVTKIGARAFYNTAFYNDENNWENGVLYCGKHLIKSTEENKGNTGINDGTVTIADEAFKNSKNLSNEISFPNSLCAIGDEAFSNTGFVKLTIGENVKHIGKNAFYCQQLTELRYNAVEATTDITVGMYDISGTPFGSDDEVKVIIGKKVKVLPTGIFSHLEVNEVVFEETSVCEDIGNFAFYNCPWLTNIEIPNSVIHIGNSAFKGCPSLASIIIPNSVQTMSDRSWSVFGHTNSYFSCPLTVYCEALEKPSEWSSSWDGGCPVVWDCKNNDVAEDGYIYAVIDGIKYRLKDDIARVTKQSKIITVANIPSMICYNNKNYTVTEIEPDAFYACCLANVTIPDTITYIGGSAFRFCDSLETIEIPNSVERIGSYAFYSCSSLIEVYIPNTVTSIGEYAFSWCRSLTNIFIPESVVSMESKVFYYSELLTIQCEASAQPSGWSSTWNADRPVVWSQERESD